MIDPAASERPVAVPERARRILACGGFLLLIVVLVPPLSSEARRYEFVEAIQFGILACLVPALLVLGAPWRFLGLARPQPSADPPAPAGAPPQLLDRLNESRRRHLGFVRSLAFAVVEIVVVVAWRMPVAVDGLARHAWLAPLEGACLLLGGLGLWLELVDSPPLSPRTSGPQRVLLAALVMWAIWISAYLVGLSQASVYGAYHHVAGVGLSFAADQEAATFVLFFVAAAVFVPVIFWLLLRWLVTEEDPDQGLYRLVRDTRRRSWTLAPEPDRPFTRGETTEAG